MKTRVGRNDDKTVAGGVARRPGGIPGGTTVASGRFAPSALAALRGRARPFPSSPERAFGVVCLCYLCAWCGAPPRRVLRGETGLAVIRERRRQGAFDHDLCRAEVVSSLPLSSWTVKDRVYAAAAAVDS